MNTTNQTGPNEMENARHDDVLAWVSKELDGELEPRERVLLEDHLGGCPRCAQVRRELQGVRGFARDESERVFPPVGLVDRVVAHVMAPEHASAAEPAQAPVLVMRRLRRSAALAAAALLVLGGIYVGRLPSQAGASWEPGVRPLEPDLERALSRGESARTRGPGFLELLLPPPPPRTR